jgi:hypothetical protein
MAHEGRQIKDDDVIAYKSTTLGRMGNLVEAVDCCDVLLTRYGRIENPTLQLYCQSALVNGVEYLLVLGRHTEANQRIQDALKRIDNTNQTYAIIHFLRWLMETDTPPPQVLTAIRALAPTVEFTWRSDDIRPLVDKLPTTRKTQAECFIEFFEQHHEITKLEACLAAHEPI